MICPTWSTINVNIFNIISRFSNTSYSVKNQHLQKFNFEIEVRW
jgi:hypothetical protein